MKYVSTRDKSIKVSFEDALFSGYAPGGGLFVPETLPPITEEDVQSFASLSFPDLAFAVLRRFISPDEVADDDFRAICQKSFHEGFDAPNDAVVPVVPVGSIYCAELWHGPTFCFKDLGMAGVINLLSHFSTKRKRKTTLLVSTTGDTGPACVHAVKNSNNPFLSLVVHYPKGQISAFQRKQMTTVNSPMVEVVSFEGGGDDMDRPIKELLTQNGAANDSSSKSPSLCGVNSYNIGRPLMQMVHFVWSYLRVCDQIKGVPGETKVDVVIPTGAMGNLAGGYMAKKMGLPLGKLCAGTNVNDISFRVIQTGKFHRAEQMEHTLSEAINIQVPYNFERLLYFLTDQNDTLVRQWMKSMESTSKLDLDAEWLAALQDEFMSARITDDEMCAVMRKAKDRCNYFIDPNTAVAFAAAEKLGYKPLEIEKSNEARACCIFATASPCKFQEVVLFAVGEKGWEEYEEKNFPKRANDFVNGDEVPPTEYKLLRGKSLEETQMAWKEEVLKLVQKVNNQ